ncbi:DUF4843 domain-containing protein [Wenyingzhuangia sp. 2_MG-2023]|uniref:DUF4843 domain-containing protein n=1 Tax=Wenyingzhuangia sp. 2_MG-2023 TaxID=3062639 RepID=UPI0026E11FE4|nr:DUF4843 domain-containing protein [Wenyingzhuangia sp. 2_MG-2023]MDO6736380.1 DUF4843 domain-containing protein [Wenyingzhuangia sp. 2_MG-2023]MDO6801309.1 DUF4843 domain-containing protein [Wenyingzhuangia sp. 1_MG-2023]
MKKINLKIGALYTLITFVFLSACAKDEITSFEGDNGVTFLPESVNRTYEKTYSFLGNETGEYIQEVDVQVIGRAAEVDRYFTATMTSDDATTATEDQFEILEGVVKANEYEGKLYVKLYNSEPLSSTTVSVNLELSDSDDFTSGVAETNDFTLYWTNQIVVPSWTYYRYFFTSVASTSAYRAIVESTGVTQFDRADYFLVGTAGATALGTQFGDYIKQWNLDHPGNPLLHDDGTLAGQEIVPRYYSKSKYD